MFALFFVIPLALVLMVSVWQATEYELIPAFTGQNYLDVFTGCPVTPDGDLCVTFKTYLSTLKFSVLTWAITALLGFSIAYFLAFHIEGTLTQTVLFIGWFGPRGLASVVFSLIALESLEMDAALEDVLATAGLTILLSVVLHGVTAAPWARRYGAWVRAVTPAAEVADAAAEPRSRGRLANQNHD